MKIFIGLQLLFLLAGISCQESSISTLTETTPTSIDSTTPETTTIADTTTHSSTTATVSPTTEAPTTPASTTTTTQKTTPIPPTTSSSTTTAPVSSTTTKPPVAELGSWNVTQDNVTCIRADLKIRFMLPGPEYISLSPNATADGSSCNSTNSTQELLLTDSNYVLLLTFEKDDKNAYLKNITLNYMLPGDNGIAYNDTGLFKVKVGNSYLCTNTETVPLLNVTMEIFEIHLQSFGSSANGDFGTAEECEADDKVNDIVPIAVGCCLLALVVIVLIAYFVGRRRSRQKGYQSV